MSKPEALLWRMLKGSPGGVRFRRQYAVGPYVADFYCPATKLVIEIDGEIHAFGDRAEHDAVRTAALKTLGLSVLRIAARDVLSDPNAIADGLIQLCSPSRN